MTQPRTVLQNIQTVVGLVEQTQRKRSFSERVADGIATFTGTVVFVLLHLIWFGVWASYNVGVFGGRPFDPYPFQLLCMLVSLEGVLLSTFVLIKQNRMSRASDRRAHLDLQVNLLAEQEMTKALQMLSAICDRMGLETDSESKEMSQVTAVAELAGELDRTMPEES